MKQLLILTAMICATNLCVGQTQIGKATFVLNTDTIKAQKVEVTTIPFSNCYCIGDDWSSKKIREIEGSILLISIKSERKTELVFNIYSNILSEGKYDILPKVFPHNLISLSNFCPNQQAFKIPFVAMKKWKLKNPLVLTSLSTSTEQSSYIPFKTGSITITKLDNLKRTFTASFEFQTTHPDGGPLSITNGQMEIKY